MKIKHTHRSKGKPYKVPRSYNHSGNKSAKGVGQHQTHGAGSKKHG